MKPNTADVPAANRTYKARIFEMIFKDRPNLLSLYNAINGTRYENPEELEINTLENAVYMSMHNDFPFRRPISLFSTTERKNARSGKVSGFRMLIR